MRDRLRLGVIGLGRGFVLTAPALRADPRIELAGAFDPRREATAQFAAEFRTPEYDSVHALLADPSIDAVYIATPHEMHAGQAIDALASGKHVLVEKPMATSVADAIAMARAAASANRALVVGPSHGFDAPVLLAAELIESGRFGPVRMVTALNFTDFMYRPRRPEEMDSERGGGVIYSQAAHQVDMVRRLVRQPVATVRAVAGEWDAGRPGEGAYQALLTFSDGAVASLSYSGYAHYDSDELMEWVSELGRPKNAQDYGAARRALAASSSPEAEATAKLRRGYGAGTDMAAPPPHHEHFGFALVSCERADLKLRPTGIEVFGNERREFVPIAAPGLPRAAVMEEFVRAARGEHPPVHDGHWGVQTMACCAALIESSRANREIDLGEIIARATGEISE